MPFAAWWAGVINEEIRSPFQSDLTEEEPGIQGMALRGGSGSSINGKIGQKSLNFFSAYIFGVTFVMEEDVAAYLADIGLLGFQGAMLAADSVPDLIEQGRGQPLQTPSSEIWVSVLCYEMA